jgi:hypothetical protein
MDDGGEHAGHDAQQAGRHRDEEGLPLGTVQAFGSVAPVAARLRGRWDAVEPQRAVA